MKAVAAFAPLAAVPAQQSHQLSQTEAVGPAALTPPLTPPRMCPMLAPVSFTHQVGTQQLLGPNRHNVNFPDVFVYLCHVSRVLDSTKSMT